MPRIRTVKPELFLHEDMFDLEQETGLPIRLAFIGLFTCCDREGRFKWRPRTLKASIFPFDEIDFSRVLDALATRGFIKKYTIDSRDFGFIPSFLTHQVINNRESASVLPEPNTEAILDATATRAPRVDHADIGERKGKERKGKEKKEITRASADAKASPIACPPDVSHQVWDDWQKLRKAKKAPVTETVIKSARREAEKANLSFENFLEVWCARGSQGLQADWLKPEERGKTQLTEHQRREDASARAIFGHRLQNEIIEINEIGGDCAIRKLGK